LIAVHANLHPPEFLGRKVEPHVARAAAESLASTGGMPAAAPAGPGAKAPAF
jgi:hypothetical protein